MLKTRVLSAIVIIIALVATMVLGGPVLLVTLYAISMIGFYELCQACKIIEEKKINGLSLVGYVFITLLYFAVFMMQSDVPVMPCMILMLMACMFVYVFTFPKYQANQVMQTVFSYVYCPVMLSFIFLTRSLPNGQFLVWLIFISSWVCDTCAYAVGMLIGKHKMAPVLSPKKSIEGGIGGIVGAAIVGAIYGQVMMKNIIPADGIVGIMAVIAAIGAVISQCGDLAASAIKRNYDIKDYGHLIPGHGGIMDRFDSVIFTAPITYFLALMMYKFVI